MLLGRKRKPVFGVEIDPDSTDIPEFIKYALRHLEERNGLNL
jgi:hypothetical protein